jgi:hypothetical protein
LKNPCFCAIVLLAVCAHQLQAGVGCIETRQRQKLEGEISIANGMFCVADTNFLATNYVRLEQLSSLRLPSPSESNAALRTVLLANGSALTRRIHSADETAIRFSKSSKDPGISTVSVARILLHATADDAIDVRWRGRIGLLLRNADFVDGEFKSLKDGKVRINSVLFGSKTFPVSQVAAIILREPIRSSFAFEIRTRDQSLWRAKDVVLAKNEIVVRDPLLPEWRIPVGSVAELRRIAE